MKIKLKMINHLILNGKKETGEKEFCKNFKNLQKKSRKCSNKIFQLALISSTSVFRLHKISLKKRKKKKVQEIPGFLRNQNNRISLALKFLLQVTKHGAYSLSKNLSTEILLLSKSKSGNLSIKTEKQKAVLTKKHLFRYYRWR
uniref:Ribosomal protein S7 n=1 Tax=Proschkinia sp. SZCZR1824 TaxID=2588390 RepID=A0A4Y5SED9_9STRA|nr:ribosomal protein S7 [Proschkinia sp. SZCZR1824]